MKAIFVVLGSLAGGVMAQTTASCPEGAATCDAAAIATPTEDHSHHDEAGSHDHDHDGHGTGSGPLPPSPTNSGECHDMGDYWHCEGPTETEKPGAAGRAEAGMGAVAVALAVALAVLGM